MEAVKRKKRPESEDLARLNFRFVAARGSGKIVKIAGPDPVSCLGMEKSVLEQTPLRKYASHGETGIERLLSYYRQSTQRLRWSLKELNIPTSNHEEISIMSPDFLLVSKLT